ncbi:Sphingolipid delta(4)-desaturase DES1-like, partial [Zancudomyces culisetae]
MEVQKGKLKQKDPRHPLYLGQWKKGSRYQSKAFETEFLDEPHLKRKKVMLQKYPEIKKLYGNEPRTALIGVFLVCIQLYMAYLVSTKWKDMNRTLLLAVTYAIGGTVSSMYGVIIHELSHCLVFKKLLYNRLFGLVINIPMVVPISQSFRRYHLEHHQFQGVKGMDPDLPLEEEVQLVSNSSFLKLLWVMSYGVMYMVRGLRLGKQPTFWEIVNTLTMVLVNTIIYSTLGGRALAYLGLSVFLGYGLHPGAAHFIQEHFIFVDGQETYSYYGPGNLLYMNIGYHNEHHDFTQ